MKAGIIGVGGRSVSFVKPVRENKIAGAYIIALSDINEAELNNYAGHYFEKTNQPALYADYRGLLDNDGIEAVIVCTPDWTHKDVAIDVMRSGKHMLLEKPMATKIEDCVAIYNESRNHDKVFMLGFNLRHTEIYKKIKQIVTNGTLGHIISIEAKEILGYMHAASFFRRWNRFTKYTGGFLNTKCCHDMDIMNWVIGCKPVYVSAFGSRTFFTEKPKYALKCRDCNHTMSCRYFIESPDYDMCPFNIDKDIVDHEVVNIEYENKVTVCFTVSMLGNEANRTMVIYGSEATLYSDFAKNTVTVKYTHPCAEDIYRLPDTTDGHGGGDLSILNAFKSAVDNGSSFNEIENGLWSSAITLAAERSLTEKRIVKIDDMLTL